MVWWTWNFKGRTPQAPVPNYTLSVMNIVCYNRHVFRPIPTPRSTGQSGCSPNCKFLEKLIMGNVNVHQERSRDYRVNKSREMIILLLNFQKHF